MSKDTIKEPKESIGKEMIALKSIGMKSTFLRENILRFAMHHRGPFSADMVIDFLLDTGIHKTTVYRNLELFKQKGLLREVDMRRESVYFEYAPNEHHHHLICTQCGFVEAFYSCGSETLVAGVLKDSKSFISIEDHSFEMFGTCNGCSC